MKRLTIFCVQMGWLLVLGGTAVAYFFWLPMAKVVTLGPIPVGVVWFGALGAVLISLTGVVEHARDWDPEQYDLWHLSRPVVGAALAVVSVLILKAGVLAIGSAPTEPGAQAPPQNLLFYLVSFLVGYREETFRELLKRLVDLLLAPATAKPAPAITSLSPATGPVAGGAPVKILGSGFGDVTAVSFGSTSAKFHVDSDGQISADLPSSPAPGPASVTVKTKAGSATASFTYA